MCRCNDQSSSFFSFFEVRLPLALLQIQPQDIMVNYSNAISSILLGLIDNAAKLTASNNSFPIQHEVVVYCKERGKSVLVL
mmetsp:Transcript_650/g.1526  ORF Transcript_650/g.1526 Transcript_650/m.1526 type:complete len:81 (+) Transcript_650:17-259(+)